MTRSKDYQHLLNSKRWRLLRAEYLRQHPLCERCIEDGRAAGIPDGYLTPAVDLHHIVPVESAHTLKEMEHLCYSWHNLKALCVSCHIKTHKEMGKNTRENHKERSKQSLQRWIDRIKPKSGE